MQPSLTGPAKTLADYTSEKLILPQLHGRDAPSVIQELTYLLHVNGCIKDLLAFYDAALNMETLHSSAMDYGIAFPHARVVDVERVSFALGRSAEPIQWRDGIINRAVHLVFLIALPRDAAVDYIPVVLSIGHLHTDPETMSRLMKAPTAAGILEALQAVTLHTASLRRQ